MERAKARIASYLQDGDKHAFFVAVDGEEYIELKEYLSNLSTLRFSSFCHGEGFPDSDELVYAAKTLKSDTVCLGVGEEMELSGIYDLMYRLKTYRFPKKLVVLCRGPKYPLWDLADRYPDFRMRFCNVESGKSYAVVHYEPSLPVEALDGFPALLRALEDGAMDYVKVKSMAPIKTTFKLMTAYSAIKFEKPYFQVPERALTEEQWRRVLCGDETLSRYLDCFIGVFKHDYEQLAFKQSTNFDEYERNIAHALLKLKPNSQDFDEKYQLRKSLVSKQDGKYLPGYIEAAKAMGSDGVNYLTDNTRIEFKAAMELASNRIALEKNFPAVRRYLFDYEFEDERLTKYFRQYKELKLFRVGAEDFLPEVARQSELRLYNEQETRAAVLERLGKGVLYWLDGLSVDFLGYFKKRLSELNLRSRIRTARAELPTLTAMNRAFYDEWPFGKFPKNERLDKLRHEPQKVPVYFCDEVFIIEDALIEIALALKRKGADKVILTSDHGSSRGPVLCRGHPIKLNATGEHGGRCCKIDARDIKPKCAVEANGYYVLTNYDRIQGGRMDGAELHGGATLEEVLVPVIEIFI